MAGMPRPYYVYVIELEQSVLQEPSFVVENQHVDPNDPGVRCFYVGRTGRTPEERFDQHRRGYRSNRFAEEFGVALCPSLYEDSNPMTYDQSVEEEVALAGRLRAIGHAVWQK